MILNKFEIFTEIQVTVQTNTGFEFLFLNFFVTISIITEVHTLHTRLAWIQRTGFPYFLLEISFETVVQL